jgi:hypothetical protein
MKARMSKERKLDVALMIGAIAMILIALPLGVWASEKWNGWLSPTFTYTSDPDEDNDTVDMPFLADLIDTTGFVASVDGTDEDAVIVNETVIWDDTNDWDAVTMSQNGTLYINWNETLDGLYNAKSFQYRFSTNSSVALDITIQAVKSDGIAITAVDLAHFTAEADDTAVHYWNWTPASMLEDVSAFKPLATDDVWIRIVIAGEEAVDLTAGDVIEFKGEVGGSNHVYAVSSKYALQATAMIFALVLGFLAIASTAYFNPLSPKGRGRRKSA